MTDQTPLPGNDTGMTNDMSSDAIKARIAQFCEWFGVEPVKLKVRKGAVYLTDDLTRWCGDEGASLDWLFCGDLKGMAAAYRKEHAETAKLRSALRRLDDAESAMLLQMMEEFQAKVTARRAQMAEAAA
ncbi:MAG: hypothetical protein ACK4GO_17180 [Gemmobacter sp.]